MLSSANDGENGNDDGSLHHGKRLGDNLSHDETKAGDRVENWEANSGTGVACGAGERISGRNVITVMRSGRSGSSGRWFCSRT